jgi:membrane fusion protein (multidrug efflux system)
VERNETVRKSERSWPRRLAPIGVLAAAVALVAAVAIIPVPRAEPKVIEPPPTNVTVEVVRAIDQVEETFDLPGSVEPNRVVKVSAEVAGRIESYGIRSQEAVWQGRTFAKGRLIDEGQPVTEGDVLIQLNREILRAEVERAEAQFAYEQSEFERLGGMQPTGATTAREINEARTKMAVSQAVLKVAREQLDRATIRSPVSGVVNRMLHEAGEYVQAGTEVAEIVEIDPVKVVVDTPERDVQYLVMGREAKVLPDPSADPLTGRITYISELADPMTRSSRVEITIPNREHRLRSGQIVRVRLSRGLRRNVVMIPLMAVMPLEQGYEVFVVRNGLAESRKVTLGFIRQDQVLAEGLAEGEQLIVQGHRLVAAGQKVNVVRTQQEATLGGRGSG